MPFVNDEHRKQPDLSIPGDRCYIHYRQMMDQWKASRRWTTFDTITKVLYPDDQKRAYFLALLVFFALHVLGYEIEKMDENGDIE